MAELIKTTDSLNDGRKKLNDAITDSNAALSTANTAKHTANLAKAESESTQTQLDTIVIEGDSSVEAAQARVNNSGTAFPTLKQRLDAEHQEVTAQLAEKAENKYVEHKHNLDKVKFIVSPPNDFRWLDAPIDIFRSITGEIETCFDVSVFKKNDGKTYYVDKHHGSNENDGLTLQTAFSSVSYARGIADCGTIMVASGYYSDVEGFSNATATQKNINIIGLPGHDVIISTRREVTWTKTSGYNHIYQTSRTQVGSVYDSKRRDKYGDYSKLIKVNSLSELETAQGTYYYNNNELYVHTIDSRPADSNIHVFLAIYNLYNKGDYTTYIENVKLYGGNNGCVRILNENENDNPLFLAKNCEIKYASGGAGGIVIEGADSYSQGVTVGKSLNDGFNYHELFNRKNKVIEVNCTGYANGIDRLTNTNNGSSIHDGGTIIRVNGQYFGNEGPNVHDINTGTESWNIGCVAYDSKATQGSRRSNYRVEQGANMWLENAISGNNENNLYVGTGSKMYIKDIYETYGSRIIDGVLIEY